MELESRSCQHCGRNYQPHRRDQRCCSKECITALSNDERGERYGNAIKKCERCGAEFKTTDWYSAKHKRFCSASCSSSHAWETATHARSVEKIERKCCVCGKEMLINPSKSDTQITCSVECRSTWQRESGLFSGENSGVWKGGAAKWWKQKARERDDFTCQICGLRDTGHRTHAHHVVPVDAGGSNDLSNLITLCNRCHKEKEHTMLMELVKKFPKAVRNLVKTLFPPIREVNVSEIQSSGDSYKRRWRQKQRELGNCLECGRPAIEGETLCAQHKQDNRDRHDKWIDKKNEPDEADDLP